MYFWIARLVPALFGLLKIFIANKVLLDPNIYISSVSIFAVVSALSCGWLNNSLLRFANKISLNYSDVFWRISGGIVISVSLISIPLAIFQIGTSHTGDFFIWMCTQSIASVGAFIFWSKGDVKSYSVALSSIATVDLFILVLLYLLRIESISILFLISSFMYILIVIVIARSTYDSQPSSFSVSRAIRYGFPLSFSLLGVSLAIHIDRLFLARYSSGSIIFAYIALYAGIDQVISAYVQVENQKLQTEIFSRINSGNLSGVEAFNMILIVLRRAAIFCVLGLIAVFIGIYFIRLINILDLPFNAFIGALLFLSISLFRLSQIANKYFEISETTSQFFGLIFAVTVAKMCLLYFMIISKISIVPSIALAGLISNLALLIICLISLNRLKTFKISLNSSISI